MNLIEQITEEFTKEQSAPRTPLTRADQIPLSYEEITPEWLTDVLCSATPGAAVTAVRLGPPDNATSQRRRLHLEYNEAGRAAGLPQSVFAKAAHELRSRIMLGVTGATHAETTFFRHARELADLRAPRAYHAAYDPVSFRSILLMEDLGDSGTPCTEDTLVTRDQAAEVVELLARLHARFADHPGLGREPMTFITWPQWFDNLLTLNLADDCDKGFRTAVEVIPERLFKRRTDVWDRTVRSVRKHDELPHTLVHSDVHLRNWYIEDGRMGLWDWQAACRGHWSRDLSYALSTALTIENRRAWEQELIRHYLDELAARGGPKVDFDDAHSFYRQQLFAALAFWTVTLTPGEKQPAEMQPEQASLVFIERITTAIDDLDALTSFGD